MFSTALHLLMYSLARNRNFARKEELIYETIAALTSNAGHLGWQHMRSLRSPKQIIVLVLIFLSVIFCSLLSQPCSIRYFFLFLIPFLILEIKKKCVHRGVNRELKVAEHSFRARFGWCNSARAQGFQKTNMPSIERSSFHLLNTRTHCVIFLYNWTQCINGFSLLLQRYVRKGNDAKNPAIFGFCLLLKEPS